VARLSRSFGIEFLHLVSRGVTPAPSQSLDALLEKRRNVLRVESLNRRPTAYKEEATVPDGTPLCCVKKREKDMGSDEMQTAEVHFARAKERLRLPREGKMFTKTGPHLDTDTTAMTIEQVEQEVAARERQVGRLKEKDA
jgi:hypothetical protein